MKPFLATAALTLIITLPLIIATTSTSPQQQQEISVQPRHRNMSCTAPPVRNYTLTINVYDEFNDSPVPAVDFGNFSVTTDPAPGNYTYPEGTVVTIRTVAGNFIDFWYLFCVDGEDPPEPSINVTMNTNHTVDVYYGPICQD